MRSKLAAFFDVLFSMGLFFTVFIAPVKFALPAIEINKTGLPPSCVDWIVSGWPNELFVCMIAAVFALYLIRLALNGGGELSVTPVDFPLVVFAGAVIMSAFLSINTHVSALAAGQLAGCAVLYHIVVNVPEKRRLILVALIASATLVSLYGIYQRFSGMEETRQWARVYMANDPSLERVIGKLSSGRVFSTFVYPNALAGYLLTVLPLSVLLCLKRFWRDDPSGRTGIVRLSLVLSLFCAALSLLLFEKDLVAVRTVALFAGTAVLAVLSPAAQAAALVLSHSYGGMVAGALVVMLVLFLYDRRVCLRTAIAAAAVLLAAGIFLMVFQRDQFVGAFKLMSVKVRLEYFWSTLMMILRRPLFGFGAGTYGNVFARFKLFAGEETQFAHNNFLQVFAESGVLAFAGYSLFCAIGWLRGFYIMKQNDSSRADTAVRAGAFLGLTGFILHSCIDFDLYVPAIALNAFVLVALIFQNEGRKTTVSVRTFAQKAALIVAAVAVPLLCALFYAGRLQAVPHFKAGMLDARSGRYAKALASFEKAAQLDRSSALYAYQAGICYKRMGSPQEAIPLLKRAVELSRATPLFHYELATCYFMAGGFEKKAESELRRAVKWYPRSIFYRLELAKFYQIIGQKEKALLEYRATLKLDPSHREALGKIEELAPAPDMPESE